MVDVREPCGALPGDEPLAARDPARIRPLERDDEAWVKSIFAERYSNRYDIDCTWRWISGKVFDNPWLYYAIRTDDAVLIALLSCYPWHPSDMECHVLIVAGKAWQVLPLLRDSLAWAKGRKCVSWNFTSATAHDFAPLMKRIGAQREDRYQIELGGG